MTTTSTDVDMSQLRMHLYDAQIKHDTIIGRTPDFRPLRMDPFLAYTDDYITVGITRTPSMMGPDYYLTIDRNGSIFYSDGVDENMIPLLKCKEYSDC